MIKQEILERYLVAILAGQRQKARSIIEETLQSGIPANSVYLDIIWPVMVEIEKLLATDRISPLQEHLATRINRTLIDQLQNKLPRRPERCKKIVVSCGPEQLHELGAQILADLFESDGWEVRFLGGGLNNQDLLEYTNSYGPDILLFYGTDPHQAPVLRRLVDTISQVNAWPNMQILVCGGLFNRAEGLWEEMGIDLFAADPVEALNVVLKPKSAQTSNRTFNRRRKRNKKPETQSPQRSEPSETPQMVEVAK